MNMAGMVSLVLSIAAGGWAEDDAGKEPIKLIYDGDLGPDPCDFATISMLHEYHKQGHIRLLGVIGATPDPYLASTFQIYNDLYENDIPIAAYSGVPGSVSYSEGAMKRYRGAMKLGCYQQQNEVLHEKYARGGTKTPPGALDTIALYRKLLAATEDNSVIVYAAGQLFNLPPLIASKADAFSPLSGKDLLRSKVSEFYFMGGYFPRSEENKTYSATDKAEWNWWALGEDDLTRQTLEALVALGKPMSYIGAEVGPKVLTGRELVNRLGRDHPTSEAYHLYRPIARGPERKLMKDNPAFDEVALFVCVEGGLGKYFGEVRGSVQVNEKGANTWIPGEGNERYITLLPGVEEELARKINDRVTGKF